MKRKKHTQRQISGFSKLSKRGKIRWIVENFFKDPEAVTKELVSYWVLSEEQQKIFDNFSENTISNYLLPYGVAPNFLINGHTYCVPMVIEESSVVAAASSAAKFWLSRGGFTTEILGVQKVGQVHFMWKGQPAKLAYHFPEIKKALLKDVEEITYNMRQRGGGILDVELVNMTTLEPNYYQIKATFNTCDSMGANFINSILEQFARTLDSSICAISAFSDAEKDVEVVMSILSNYTPECLVRAHVSCPVQKLGKVADMDAETFARRFCQAVRIAQIDPFRATTHNKGIFNGVDAVVIATGNDFRAVEACGHTYAARDGQYRSLSNCTVENGVFTFWLDLPIAVGTVGGLTNLHPIAKRSLELLENPSAEELMQVIAATGLAQNFAAIRSLVTTGIQQGHMKMHLINILNHLEASEREVREAIVYFKDKVVSFSAVRDFLELFRRDASSNSKSIPTE